MKNAFSKPIIAQVDTSIYVLVYAETAIALTAYASELSQRQALAAGFQLHLAKPIEPEQLVKTIAQVVTQSLKRS